MPLYSASPPQTPPAIRSVPLRRNAGRAGGVLGSGVEVMARGCRAAGPGTIGEHPDPSPVRYPGTRRPSSTASQAASAAGTTRKADIAATVPTADPSQASSSGVPKPAYAKA